MQACRRGHALRFRLLSVLFYLNLYAIYPIQQKHLFNKVSFLQRIMNVVNYFSSTSCSASEKSVFSPVMTCPFFEVFVLIFIRVIGRSNICGNPSEAVPSLSDWLYLLPGTLKPILAFFVTPYGQICRLFMRGFPCTPNLNQSSVSVLFGRFDDHEFQTEYYKLPSSFLIYLSRST